MRAGDAWRHEGPEAAPVLARIDPASLLDHIRDRKRMVVRSSLLRHGGADRPFHRTRSLMRL